MEKKIIFLSLTMISSLSLLGCNDVPSKKKEYEPEVINYQRVDTVSHEGYCLQSGEKKVININFESKNLDYVRLDIRSDIDLKGTYHYSSIEDPTKTVDETVFLEKCSERTQYCNYFDAFRPEVLDHAGCKDSAARNSHTDMGDDKYGEMPMARGRFSKKIETLTLENVSENAGSFVIYAFYVSDRKLNMEEVYLEQGNIKIGIDLMGGGTLTYLERTNYKTSKATYNIDEVLTNEDKVYIGVDAQKYVTAGGTLGSEDHHVNLINYYDAGRQIQQSFYADVGGSKQSTKGENGYTRTKCYTADSGGYYWPYNPVQGGDVHCNVSQIVEYRRTENSIYTRCKPLDWACNNSVTDSYMENWYSIENDTVFVTNRFTNFAGFTGMADLSSHGLELPATYIAQALNHYVTYQGETPWQNDTTGLINRTDMPNWKYGSDVVRNHPEDWFAWVNDEDFGVGMYIPDVTIFASGRSATSTSYDEKKNTNAFDSPMGDPERLARNKKPASYAFQSCYVSNTDYTAPEINTTMLDYIPFKYSYALCVDYIPVMRNNFKNIFNKDLIDNSSMFIWDETIQQRKN